MKNKTTIIIVAAAILVVISFFAFLLIGLTDPRFKKNSLYYFIYTTSLVRNIPQIEIVGEAEYFSRHQDGTAPESGGVMYCSSASKETIVEKLNQYAIENGYVRDKTGLFSSDQFGYIKAKGKYTFGFGIDRYGCGENWRVMADESFW